MSASAPGTYCFDVEWLDTQANVTRKYQLLYFTQDDTIEMYDVKNRRTFLKRCSYPSIKLADLYIGAQVIIYARQLSIVGYGDSFTQQHLSMLKGRSIAIIKPKSYADWGAILSKFQAQQLVIGRLKMLQLTPELAKAFYGDSGITERVQELSAGPILVVEIIGRPIQSSLIDQIQSQTAAAAQANHLHVHISNSDRSAEMEINFFFNNPSLSSTATFTNCTVGIIKPHAIQAGLVGEIFTRIYNAGYDITALQSFNLDRQAAEEFLEVYKGVVPDYNNMVEQLISGSIIALEIRSSQSSSIVNEFREFVGPADPAIAKYLRPSSLRAQFGIDKVKNAVHCTDLEEDGVLESQFFFDILQNKK